MANDPDVAKQNMREGAARAKSASDYNEKKANAGRMGWSKHKANGTLEEARERFRSICKAAHNTPLAKENHSKAVKRWRAARREAKS